MNRSGIAWATSVLVSLVGCSNESTHSDGTARGSSSANSPDGVGSGSSAAGVVLASEPFDYSTNSLTTDWSGGSGFPKSWQIGGFNVRDFGYEIAAGSLTYPGVTSSGNRLMSVARDSMLGMTRPLPALPADGGYHISFLLRPEGALNSGDQQGFFGVGLATRNHERELFFGKPGAGDMTHYVVEERGGDHQQSTRVPIFVDKTVFMVIRVTPGVRNDKFDVFVNAESSASPATTKILEGKESFTDLMVYSTGAFSLDEIRLTKSWPR